jgi:5-methylcytosine-specific restriction endonuclease McrA
MIPPTYGSLCTTADPTFYEYRYQEQIPYCKRDVTTERKIEICKRDGVEDRSDYTVDHIIPLSLGGSNSDDNLWCQHKLLAVTNIEYEAYKELENGSISQKQAIDKVLKAKFSKKIFQEDTDL